MNHETDRRLEAMRSRLAHIAASLDELDHRREALAAAQPAAARAAARAYLHTLRDRLAEAEAELEGLRSAMVNRGVIERAKGMLMLRLDIDEDAAFEHLRAASMRLNRRVVDVAEDVVRNRAGARVLS